VSRSAACRRHQNAAAFTGQRCARGPDPCRNGGFHVHGSCTLLPACVPVAMAFPGSPAGKRAMSKIRVRDLDRLLPAIDVLRPLRRELVRTSVPDPADRWSRSGELATAAERIVDLSAVGERIEAAMAAGSTARRDAGPGGGGSPRIGRAEGDPEGAVHAYLEACARERARSTTRVRLALARAALDQAVRSRTRGSRRWPFGASAARSGPGVRWTLPCGTTARPGRSPAGPRPPANRRRRPSAPATCWSRWGGGSRPSDGTARRSGARGARGRGGPGPGALARGPEPPHRPAVPRTGRRQRALAGAGRRRGPALEDGSAEILFDNARGQLHMAEERPDAAADRFLSALLRGPAALRRGHDPANLSESLLARGRLLDAAEEARAAEAEAIAHGVTLTLPARVPNPRPMRRRDGERGRLRPVRAGARAPRCRRGPGGWRRP
jgi:hypothetical protein